MYLNINTRWWFSDEDWKELDLAIRVMVTSNVAERYLASEKETLEKAALDPDAMELRLQGPHGNRTLRILRAQGVQHYPALSLTTWTLLLATIMFMEAWQTDTQRLSELELGESTGIVPNIRDTYQFASNQLDRLFPARLLVPYESYLDRHKLGFSDKKRGIDLINAVLARYD